jgi:hypothetical protein
MRSFKIFAFLKRFMPVWAWLSLALIIGAILVTVLAGLFLASEDNNSDKISSVTITKSPEIPGAPLVGIANIPSATPQPTQTASPTVTRTPTRTPEPVWLSRTPEAEADVSPAETTPTPESDSIDEVENCAAPEGWETYQVQPGDTLFAFQLGAKRAGQPTDVDEIIDANCLGSTVLQIGQTLWLPPGAADNAPVSVAAQPTVAPDAPRNPNCPGCTITIQPGWRLEQIAEAIDRAPVAFSGAAFLALTKSGGPIPPRDFLSSVPAGGSLEGFMFPGTYTLSNDTTAEGFRDMLLDAFGTNVGAIAGPGMNTYQTVVLASIIQRESFAASEQSLVSSVMYNRMNAGKGLAVTVTIQYAIGQPGNWWPRPYAGITDINSPYNTNLNLGLPPTAISNPSLSALQAAANPAQTNYLYFTANCHGPGNAYAATYEEHLANVRCE